LRGVSDANANADSGTFRLAGNQNTYSFIHPFKSRFLVVEVDEIPQDLLTSLSICNIEFRLKPPEPDPDHRVTLCKTNAELADSNMALRIELEELQSRNNALSAKFFALHEQLLVLAKTLETN
jgi:hypothetical protein